MTSSKKDDETIHNAESVEIGARDMDQDEAVVKWVRLVAARRESVFTEESVNTKRTMITTIIQLKKQITIPVAIGSRRAPRRSPDTKPVTK